MKRSEINSIMRSAEKFIVDSGFALPPFARWTPDEWRTKGPEVREIADHGLGWDVTDFGSGHFLQCGLFLFTLRNGNHADSTAKTYAEKIMVVEEGQVTPMHFHWKKTEDIINRGGGRLAIQLYAATRDEDLDKAAPVHVSMDGVVHKLKAGATVELAKGESITLTPRLYHTFWGVKGSVLVGEVSSVNDDATDNRFHRPAGRFPAVEEDELPLHLLVSDYPRYYRRS